LRDQRVGLFLTLEKRGAPTPYLLADLRLPGRDKQLWPPPEAFNAFAAALAAASPPPRYDQRYSPDWWALKDERERRAQYEADRVALQYRERKFEHDKAENPNAHWLPQEKEQLDELREKMAAGN
jgi:hypothetical protein